MTRENLIDAIYHNTDKWSCTDRVGCIYDCRKCAENLLAEYEKKIYDKGYKAGMKVRNKNGCKRIK